MQHEKYNVAYGADFLHIYALAYIYPLYIIYLSLTWRRCSDVDDDEEYMMTVSHYRCCRDERMKYVENGSKRKRKK